MTHMSQKPKDSEYTPWKNPPRKRWKTFLKVMVAGMLVLAVGIGAAVTLVDKDTLRTTLAQSLSEKTGTQVEIQFLELGFSRGLALEAGGLTVRDASGGRQLLWAESLLLEIKVLPLLTGVVVVENADIIKPRIKVYRESDATSQPKFQKTSLATPIRRTRGDYSMTQVIKPEGTDKPRVTVPQPAAQPLVDREIIDEFRRRLENIHITAENIHVEQGTLLVIDQVDQETHESQPLGFSFNLKIKRPSPKVIDLTLEDLHLNMGPLFLLGRVEADDILSDASQLEVQLRTKPFELLELKRAFRTHAIRKSSVSEKSIFPIHIEQLTLLASCPLNSLVDVPTFNRTLKAEARFITRDTQVPIGDYEMAVSQVKGKARWDESFILYELQGETLNGKVRIEGQQAFPLNPTGEANPLITTDVQLTALDFSQLQVPEGWQKAKGRVSGVLQVTFPLSLEGPPFISGSLIGENLVLASKETKWVSRKTEIQFESPPEKPMSMDVLSQGTVVDHIRFKKIQGRLSFPPGQVVLEKSTWTPPHGSLTASGNYDTESKKYRMEFLGKDLWAGDYSDNQLQGIMRAHGSMNGHIPEEQPAIRGLFGTVSVKVTPVNIDKADELKTLLAVLDPAFFKKHNARGARFDYLGGNFKINKGKFKTQNLALKGELVDVYLEGLFDGHTQSLNMIGKALPKISMNRALKNSPKLAKLLSKAQSKGSLLETRFKLEGPAQKPQMTLLGIRPSKKSSRQLLNDLDKESPRELIKDFKGLFKKKGS